MSSATVVVATFGDFHWRQLAEKRAIPSARALGVPVIHEHRETLAAARNAGLEQVETEFVIHLDADDELDPLYLEEMESGWADVRAPSILLIRGNRRRRRWTPRVFGHEHRCSRECLPLGSWICVGAYARAELLRSVGGWEEWPIYEDWALWLRCYAAGASFELIDAALYWQHLSPASRNHAGEAFEQRDEWHRRIVAEILGKIPA